MYLVCDGEMMLDVTVADAWAHVIEYPSGQNHTLVEHISGSLGKRAKSSC